MFLTDHRSKRDKMYVNVNLSPPQLEMTESSVCSGTPKTPEILNSLISMSTTSSVPSSSPYTQRCSTELLSPASSIASPSDDLPSTSFGDPKASRAGTLPSFTSKSPSVLLSSNMNMVTAAPSQMTFPITPPAELPSPLKPPDLPSLVNTVKFTKSALIKEGLKHQITSKLKAAGLDTKCMLKQEKIKQEELTHQDEERRLRRRERNKVAATKCRNKKKEKAVILVSESESVESQNIRLKNEIQRLTSERQRLVNILDNPSHISSCRLPYPRRISCCSAGSEQGLVDYLFESSEQEEPLLKNNCSTSLRNNVPYSTANDCGYPFYSPPSVSTIASDSASPSYANMSCSSFSPCSLQGEPSPQLHSGSSETPPHNGAQSLTTLDVSYTRVHQSHSNYFVSNTSNIKSPSGPYSVTSPTTTVNVQNQGYFSSPLNLNSSESCIKTLHSLEPNGGSSTVHVLAENTPEYSFDLDVKELNIMNNADSNLVSFCNLNELRNDPCPFDKSTKNELLNDKVSRATLLSTHCRYSPYDVVNGCPNALPSMQLTKDVNAEPKLETYADTFTQSSCSSLAVNQILLDPAPGQYYNSV